ncbi:MAG: Lcl C-terminal domain-containing protein [Planctomycetota bacterium]|jgi:hypothetical protein
MTDEKKTNNPEMEKIELERFKEWRKIITVAIAVWFGSILVVLINYSIQGRQLEQQKLINKNELELQRIKAESDQLISEMKFFGNFIDHALADDHNKRLRFAEFFAKLTISGELREKWEDYSEGIRDTIKLLEEKKVELAKAINAEKKKKITTEVVQLKALLGPLLKKSEVYLDRKEAGVGRVRRPLKYIDNEYELQSDGKVVYDKATGLMWQQSGSGHTMVFEDTKNYIAKLNSEKFASYNNWRLPTLEEAKSLLEPKKNETNNLYTDPIFDKALRWIWTSDKSSATSAWVVRFSNGSCFNYPVGFDMHYVRAVR